jgi:hypothetical protein
MKSAIETELRRSTAYHEAGHVVARMFTGLEASHILKVTIKPEGDKLGYERSERCLAETTLHVWPRPYRTQVGRALLLCTLAGRGAEFRAGDAYGEEILDGDAIWMAEDDISHDLTRATRISQSMASPHVGAWRHLKLAEKWVLEMLDISEVWQTAETLAEMLLKRETLDDPEEILSTCEPIMSQALTIPKWKRRLGLGAHKGAKHE